MNRTILASGLLVLASSLEAATLYMKDGGKLTGTLLSSSSTEVVLKSGSETFRLRPDQIDHIDYGEPAPQEAKPSQAAPSEPESEPAPRYVRVRPVRVVRELPETRFGEGDKQFSIDLGVDMPYSRLGFGSIGGGTERNGSGGGMIGFSYLSQLSNSFGLGGEFDYLHRGAAYSESLLPNAGSVADGDDVLLLATARAMLSNGRSARPYVSAGLGAHYSSTFVDATPLGAGTWSDTGTNETRRLIDGSGWGWASSLRLGIEFYSMDPTIFGLEFGWLHLAGSTFSTTAAGQALGLSDMTGPIDIFSVMGRFAFKL